MSTTTTTALTATTLVGMLPAMSTTSDKTCPTCGQEGFPSQQHSAEEAQQRIKELEGQVLDLNSQVALTGKTLLSLGYYVGFRLFGWMAADWFVYSRETRSIRRRIASSARPNNAEKGLTDIFIIFESIE